MNADLKRVRDSAVDDAGPGRSKKRALSSASPAPAESEDSGIEEWMKVVEVGLAFRRVDPKISVAAPFVVAFCRSPHYI